MKLDLTDLVMRAFMNARRLEITMVQVSDEIYLCLMKMADDSRMAEAFEIEKRVGVQLFGIEVQKVSSMDPLEYRLFKEST